MTQHRLFVGLLAGLLAGLVVTPERAEACGGCFSPPETVTTVESHRMVVSLSTAQTTLWDQIRYAGEPEDFVWVLPVPDGAATTVEVADPAFFDEMEAYTQPILQPPFPPGPVGCAPAPNGCGFGAADAGATSAARTLTPRGGPGGLRRSCL